jgi:16S rRNA processing protein RimM
LAGKRVAVARIGAAHGIRGEVKLFVHADDPMDLTRLGALEDASGARRFRIASLRPVKDHAIARFEGIADRTAAKALTNLDLYVPRERLPKLDAGRYYHADLVGLRIEATSGETLGTVAAVLNFGAGDVLEIEPAGGGERAMVPFVDRFVPEVDVAGGRVVIDPPAGTFGETPARRDPRPRRPGKRRGARRAKRTRAS